MILICLDLQIVFSVLCLLYHNWIKTIYHLIQVALVLNDKLF